MKNHRGKHPWQKVRSKDHAASCSSKARHDTEFQALASWWVRKKATGDYLRVYPCPRCAGWHLTSTPLAIAA